MSLLLQGGPESFGLGAPPEVGGYPGGPCEVLGSLWLGLLADLRPERARRSPEASVMPDALSMAAPACCGGQHKHIGSVILTPHMLLVLLIVQAFGLVQHGLRRSGMVSWLLHRQPRSDTDASCTGRGISGSSACGAPMALAG